MIVAWQETVAATVCDYLMVLKISDGETTIVIKYADDAEKLLKELQQFIKDRNGS